MNMNNTILFATASARLHAPTDGDTGNTEGKCVLVEYLHGIRNFARFDEDDPRIISSLLVKQLKKI